MFYHPDTHTYVREGAAFTLDGVQYPANWLNLSTPEDKAAHGLVEVVTVGTRADECTHFVTEELVGAELRIVNTPKPPEMIAAMCKAKVDAKLAKVRDVREAILNRLAGIALNAQLAGDSTTLAAYAPTRQGLLDITKDLPADPAQIDGAVMGRYSTIVSALPQSMVKAFAGVDL